MINDLQKDRLQIFLQDKLLFDTVKQVLDMAIEREKPRVHQSDANHLLGERFRAYEEAKNLIARGFIDLETYESMSKKKKSFNRAK